MRMSDANPVFSTDLSGICGVVKKTHNGITGESRLILPQSLHVDEANAAVAHRVIVIVAVCFLNDYLILEAVHVGRHGMARGRAVCHCYARSRRQSYCGSRARCDHCALAAQFSREVFACCFLQVFEEYRMLGSLGD